MWHQELNHRIVQEGIGAHCVEIKNPIKGVAIGLRSHKSRQSPSNGLFSQIPLPKDCKDILGPGPRRLTQQVLATHALEIFADGKPWVPGGQKRFRIWKQSSRLDDLTAVWWCADQPLPAIVTCALCRG